MRTVLLAFLCLQFFLPRHLPAQVEIGGREYSQLLWGEDEILEPEKYGNGSFLRTETDFIRAAGKYWKGNPPPSLGSFSYEGKTITNSGEFNNQAVDLLEKSDPEDRKKAIDMLDAGVRFDPRFFPFRYNLGRAYEIEQNYREAIQEFEYAETIIPDYFRTYLHLGKMAELQRNEVYAISQWKQAVHLNPFNTEGLVMLAEYYLKTNLKRRAEQYIQDALRVDPQSPNARLGLARIYMTSNEEYKAYKLFKDTQLTDEEGNPKKYDKKFHFYYAEVAGQLGDYVTSRDQYEKLLQFPNDPFFSEYSYRIIEKRRDLAAKFANVRETQNQGQ